MGYATGGDVINAPRTISCSSELKFYKIHYSSESNSDQGTIYYTECTNVTTTSVNTPSIQVTGAWQIDFYDSENHIFYTENISSHSTVDISLDSNYETARDVAYSSNSSSSSSGGLRTKFNPMGGFNNSSSGINLRWSEGESIGIAYGTTGTLDSNLLYSWLVGTPLGYFQKNTTSYWETPYLSFFNNSGTSISLHTSYGFLPTGCYDSYNSKLIAYTSTRSGTAWESTWTNYKKESSDGATFSSTQISTSLSAEKMHDAYVYSGTLASVSHCFIQTGSSLYKVNNDSRSQITGVTGETFSSVYFGGINNAPPDEHITNVIAGVSGLGTYKWNDSSSSLVYSLVDSNSPFYDVCSDDTHLNGLAVGDNRIVRITKSSTNPVVFTSITPPSSNETFSSCCYGLGYYVVGSESGNIYVSDDLNTWQKSTTFSGAILSLIFSNNKFYCLYGRLDSDILYKVNSL